MLFSESCFKIRAKCLQFACKLKKKLRHLRPCIVMCEKWVHSVLQKLCKNV